MSNSKSNYESKVDELQRTIRWRQRTCRTVQLMRGLSFVLFGAGVIAALTGGLVGVWAYVVPAIPFVGLIVAAAYNETIEFRQQVDRMRLYINQLQILRIDRNWSLIPETVFEVPKNRTNLSDDLDLFGKASLFKLVCVANTPLGISKIGDWLINPARPDEIQRRQESVAALKPESQLREDMQLLAHSVSEAQTDPNELLEWSRGSLWLKYRNWLLWLARISALVMFGCLAWFFIPGAPKLVLGLTGMAMLATNIVISVAFAGSIHKIFNSVGYRQRDVSAYVDLFQLSRSLPGDAQMLDDIKKELCLGKDNAVSATGKLQRIIGLAQMRRSGMMFLVYIILQFLFLIDIHTLKWLEDWHEKHAARVGDWLEAVARWEALCSLSNLAYHQDSWTFPNVDLKFNQIEAKQLGHPLLADEQRVCNDVNVGPRDSILLVTGSNMSGKSTLLRSIGLNSALAQAGSVVCADHLQLPPLQIETSMRIGDSISEGVSFFMAELKRLRQITLEAEQVAQNDQRTLLFLLDEILQGTNSRERQIAVIRVCEHLLESGAIGAISTHDLELAEADTLRDKCHTVHFREFFEDNEEGKKEMRFDYMMRQGVSPTTNALKLLEMVGLVDRNATDKD